MSLIGRLLSRPSFALRPRSSRMTSQGRDVTRIANNVTRRSRLESLQLLPLAYLNNLSSRPLPSITGDRRFWHPAGDRRPALLMDGRVSAIQEIDPSVRKRPLPSWWPRTPDFSPRIDPVRDLKSTVAHAGKFGFTSALRTAICVKRSQRREIFHALRLAGKIGQRKPKFDAFSWVRC